MIMERWAQVCANTEIPIFEDTRKLLHLEGKWAKQLHKEMREIRCKLHMHNKWIPKIQRNNNTYIMDEVMNSKLVPKKHITIINWCRMYMRQICLLEATATDGKKLSKYFDEQEPPGKIVVCDRGVSG